MKSPSSLTRISLTDTLAAISHYLPKGRKGFVVDDAKFYRFFDERREKYPEILGELKFESDTPCPKSPELIESIHALHCAGYLLTPQGHPNEYQFNSIICEWLFSLKSREGEITPDQLSQIEQIAKEFDKKLATNSISMD